MRKNRIRKNNVKKERIIMIASSAFVLAALTMTGIYIKNQSAESKDEGYTLDFTALENNVENKYQEIAPEADLTLEGLESYVTEDDLDYSPLEVGSTQIEIPGLTDNNNSVASGSENTSSNTGNSSNKKTEEGADAEAEVEAAEETPEEIQEEVTESAQTAVEGKTLSYTEGQSLVRPAGGDILIHYSMSSSVYFATLDQYKYNSAVILGAAEGDSIGACADGQVVSVFFDEEIGYAITLDLGNGYQATYGQLKDIPLTQGSYVNAGELIGYVASPTKYYSVEGTNVYFRMTRDGKSVNPEGLF